MRVSIVLPTYCEQGNIDDLLVAIENALSSEEWQVEILVVDDHSPDGTAEVVQRHQEALLSRYSGQSKIDVHLNVRLDERGLATAIKSGILSATGDVVVVMDTDFNHDPLMIPQMVHLLDYYDMVIGSRFVMGGGMEDRQRYYNSFLYNLFVRSILHLQIQDNLSGFFAVRRNRLSELDLDRIFCGYGEYFIRLLYLARRRKFRMLEVPVFYILRRHGQSKSRFFHMLKDYSVCVLSLRFGKGWIL